MHLQKTNNENKMFSQKKPFNSTALLVLSIIPGAAAGHVFFIPAGI